MQISKLITLSPEFPGVGTPISLSVLSSVNSSTIDLTVITDTPDPVGEDSRAGDEAALEALYVSTNGDSWTDNTGWASSGMSLDGNIYGVETETIGGELRVTSIKLNGDPTVGNNGSVGGNNLTGSLPSEIGNLKQCTYFNVKQNDIGGQIPTEIGQMTSLTTLLLNGRVMDPNLVDQHHPGKSPGGSWADERSNHFGGPLPSTIGNLTNLVYLECNGDGFNVEALTSIPTEIENCTSLQFLHLGFNNISVLPNELGTLPMVDLCLAELGPEDERPYVQGGFPAWIEQYTQLKFCWFQNNDGIGGSLPATMANSSNLETFLVDFCDLTGQVPTWLCDNDSLEMVQLAWNNLSGDLPDTFNLSSIAAWTIVGSTGMTGDIPHSFWNSGNIINTDFDLCGFSGTLPQDLTHLNRLRNLRVGDNELTGPIPDLDFANLGGDFSRCHFHENYFTFADFLRDSGGTPIIDRYKNFGLTTLRITPQKKIGQSNGYNRTVGQSVTIDDFDLDFTHANNTYQWYKDGSAISGETNKSLSLSNLQTSDSGTYHLEVNNPGLAELTLESQDIILTVE